MKRRITILVLALVAMLAFAQSASKQEMYIERYSKIAVSEMQRTGVPASITLAQGLLESGAGQSSLASKGNNHFGIKCHGWKGKTMRLDDDAPNECFRVYKNADESFRDHSDFLRYRDRYAFLFDLDPSDYKGWCRGLKKAGYATDPKYAEKLIDMIEKYDLTRFDKGVYIPDSPGKIESESIEAAASATAMHWDETMDFKAELSRFQKNKVEFIISKSGDTYKKIALENDLFVAEICRFNDVDKEGFDEDRELLPGTVVYVQAKKNKAVKGLDKHIVGEEPEDLREICQRYAVTVKSVLRRNHLTADYVPSEGDVLLLR